MKILKQSLFVALMMFLCISVAAADENSGQASIPGPNVVSQAKYPLNVGSGEYDLMTAVLDFPAGAGFANHTHGGNVLVICVERRDDPAREGHREDSQSR